MSTAENAPPEFWETRNYRGRPFFHFDLKVRDGDIPFSVPCRIADRYEVREVIARGGGGVVFAAIDQVTTNPVLVKCLAQYDMLRRDLSEPLEEMVESIRRGRHHLQTERRILVQLRNAGSNSVPLPCDYAFDSNPALRGPYWTQSGHEWMFDDASILHSEPFLVLQHVDGMNLKDVLQQLFQNGLEEPLALRIIDQVARVIELVQQPLQMPQGQTWRLVYQDLKPANILIDRHGHATVLDFGGCQLVIDETLVLHGSHSAGYCAPECGRSHDPLHPSVDCYGLGTTLFHMLTGVGPRSLLPKDIAPEDSRAVRIDADQLSTRCSKPVVDLVSRCVSWEPENRIASAREFRQALAPLLASA